MKTCIYCAEEIKDDANICKHCGKEVKSKDLAKHVSIFSILLIAYGTIKCIVGIVIINILSMAGDITGNIDAMRILSIIGDSVGGILIVLGIPSIICGIGLYNLRRWSRIIALVICCLSLISIPFGTALGIYGLWVLLNEESKALFN